MNLYIERISEQTYNEIKQFLADNPSNAIDFYTAKERFNLHKKAFDELYESTSAFRIEFDSIISDYQSKTTGEDSYKERMLIAETNQKLSNLYSNFIKNQEVWDMLELLSSKTIKNND